MNSYEIHYKLATTAELLEPMEYAGFTFRAYDLEKWWTCHAWVANKTVQAPDYHQAVREFTADLEATVVRIGVVSQCSFRVWANSFLVYRTNNNATKLVYLYLVRSYRTVGLHFEKEQLSEVVKVEKINSQVALHFINEAANASTAYAKIAMLLIAVEALAGQEVGSGLTRTNKEGLKNILGQELYDRLYTYGTGLRHQLFHGSVNDHGAFNGLSTRLYELIRAHLMTAYGVAINTEVVNPQRNLGENFEVYRTFKEFKAEPVFDLKVIEEAMEEREDGYRQDTSPTVSEAKIFNDVMNNPEDY